MEKKFFYEIKDRDGVFKKRLDAEVTSEPSFQNIMNSGFTELKIRYAASFEDYGEGVWMVHDYICTLYAVTEKYPTGKAIFQGSILKYSPVVSDEEYAEFTVIGIQTDLMRDYYRADDMTLEVVHSGDSPEEIIESIIDNYRANQPNDVLDYTGSSLDPTGFTMSDQYVEQKHLQAIDRVMDSLDSTWYWRIDIEDGEPIFHLHEVSVSADHEFTIGKDVKIVKPVKTIEGMVNRYNFWNQKKETDPEYLRELREKEASEAQYGIRSTSKTDGRVTVEETVDRYAETAIGLASDPRITVEAFEVLSNYSWNGQTLEDIKPGDICRIKNLRGTSTTFTDTMKIVAITYTGSKVSLQLEELYISVTRLIGGTEMQQRLKSLEDTVNRIEQILWTGSDIIRSSDYDATISGFLISGDLAEFNNIFARGTIYANAGSIGGWDIQEAYIAKDTGTNATSAGMAPNDWPFFAGATYANRATAPYRVNPAGGAFFSSITITGGQLDIGSGNNSAHIDSNGNIWTGHANLASAKFKALNSGAATATDITITGGSIDIDSKFSVDTDGIVNDFRTEDSGARILLDGSDTFDFYKSDGTVGVSIAGDNFFAAGTIGADFFISEGSIYATTEVIIESRFGDPFVTSGAGKLYVKDSGDELWFKGAGGTATQLV